jgi:hypothetical protein
MHDLEQDLKDAAWLCEKVRSNEGYAQNLYAAMCNREFVKHAVLPILKNETWGCSWRYAGGIIADIRSEGDYLDWYCSGMGGLATYDHEEGQQMMKEKRYVAEATVTDEIRKDLKQLGWIVLDQDDN